MIAVEFKDLTKAFGDCYSNRGVNLQIRSGSIHAIIGENGAGKSTAMKMLYGMLEPTSGEIRVRGKVCKWKSPHDAIKAGIGMVHQHFMLAEPMSVLENILVGAETPQPNIFTPIAWMDSKSARKKLDELSTRYGLKVNWDAKVEDLSVGIHQRIEILKLLYRDANILILDEPTAVLTPPETAELFVQLRKMRDEGKTILIITHKLKEVMELAEEATVLRAGQVVGHRKVSGSSVEDLAHLMVGREVVLTPPKQEPPNLGETRLLVKKLTLRETTSNHSKKILSQLDFEVRGGEIVGIAGVEGNGQSELIQLLLQPQKYHSQVQGEVQILGQLSLAKSKSMKTSAIKKLGVAAVPEDRLKEGLLLGESVSESFLLGFEGSASFSHRGILSRKEVSKALAQASEHYDIRPRNAEIPAGQLSGGNQQKVIIAREFANDPKLLIVAQPTRGVDVGAIEFIHAQILAARTRGAAILLISSELEEVMALSDRILVFFEGKIAAQVSREDADEKTLGYFMAGGEEKTQ